MKPTFTSRDVEVAVANLIGYRKHTIVPNVSWGLGLYHECDMLVLDDKNRFTEIEIKVSKSDLKKDFDKKHGHKSRFISRLIYAVSEPILEAAEQIVDTRFGIISVSYNEKNGRYTARWVRQCKHIKGVDPVSPDMIQKFMKLGCMRIWSLKTTISEMNRHKKILTK